MKGKRLNDTHRHFPKPLSSSSSLYKKKVMSYLKANMHVKCKR